MQERRRELRRERKRKERESRRKKKTADDKTIELAAESDDEEDKPDLSWLPEPHKSDGEDEEKPVKKRRKKDIKLKETEELAAALLNV